MKFPSIFRQPRYQRFHIEPRYYDPIKEDLKQREERIKKELEQGNNGTYAENISEAFSKRRGSNYGTALTQVLFIILFLAVFFGYIYYGNGAFYGLILLLPIYILIKRKR